MKDPLLVPGWVLDAWRFKLTWAARALGYSAVIAGLGSISVLIPVYQLFCGLAALLLIPWLIGLALRPSVAIRGRFPEKTSAGQPVTAEFTVTNRSRWTCFELALGLFKLPRFLQQADHDRAVRFLSRNESVSIPVTLIPRRRGLYELPPMRGYSLFPLGIFRSGKSRQSLPPLLVLPRYHPLNEIDVPVGNRYQPGGIALTSHVGESPEYIGNREYVPGEPVRRLDFRSWARLGKPVVREYQEEYYCRIALVLDTYIPRTQKLGPEGFPQLEAAVSLAASVANALSQGEYIIDIFAAGPELYVFRAGRHTAHFENVLEILACVDACRDNPFEIVSPAVADELSNISATICLFLDWDQSRKQLARTVLEAGSSLKVIVVRDGETTDPLHEAECEIAQYSLAQITQRGLDAV